MYTVLLLKQAAIDEQRSQLAGQEVVLAKAIAAETKEGHHPTTEGELSMATKKDVERDLEARAERKKAHDEMKAEKAGEDYKHVSFLSVVR